MLRLLHIDAHLLARRDTTREESRGDSKARAFVDLVAHRVNGERNATVLVVPQERGTRMLRAQRSLIGQILEWIASPIKPEAAASTGTVVGVSTRPAFYLINRNDKGVLLDDTGTPPPSVSPSDDGEE